MGQQEVLDFLKKYSDVDRVFTAKQISEFIKVNKSSVGTCCKKLRRGGDICYIIEKCGNGKLDCYKYYYRK